MTKYNIQSRTKVLVNTDPQRRCYNGCHFSSELVWTDWKVVDFDISEQKVEERITFWKELNDYAVSQRGKSAYSEFKASEVN